MKALVVAFLISICSLAIAHEGHDQVPGQLRALHGGSVKQGKQLNLEYVVAGTLLKLYPISHEGADLDISKVKISATSQAPKGKPTKLELILKDKVNQVTLNFGDAYRLTVVVTTEVAGKKDIFTLQAEQ
jgi:hypothetical protein